MKRFVVSIFILTLILFSSLSLAVNEDRVSLGYIYNLSRSHTDIVKKTNGNINTVSPTYFDLNLKGHLVVSKSLNQKFVDSMHEQNVLVTPVLSNHWARGKVQAGLNNSYSLAKEIVEAIDKYNLDGVNIDFENLKTNEKDKFTDFIRVLSEKMPEGKILSISVAANPNKLKTTWVAAYDYENLAKYADYLVLMAYDEHAEGGSAGPVASISYVEASIKATLESVSRDKVVLGIPLYGRFWKEGSDVGGEAIVMSQVETIASKYRKNIPRYDERTGTTTLTIEVEEDNQKAVVNGRLLEEGTYTFWYENERSIKKKLEIMNKYGLKGSALWAIGNEGKNFWNYYSKEFNNKNYESELSIKAREYYKEVERIMQIVEPLATRNKRTFKNPVSRELNWTCYINIEAITPHVEDEVHSPEEKKQEIDEPYLTKEKVEIEIKSYDMKEKLKIAHIMKRNFLKSY